MVCKSFFFCVWHMYALLFYIYGRPPYFSVNGMMILFLAYKNGFKNQYNIYFGYKKYLWVYGI